MIQAAAHGYSRKTDSTNINALSSTITVATTKYGFEKKQKTQFIKTKHSHAVEDFKKGLEAKIKKRRTPTSIFVPRSGRTGRSFKVSSAFPNARKKEIRKVPIGIDKWIKTRTKSEDFRDFILSEKLDERMKEKISCDREMKQSILDAFEGINSYLQENPHLHGDFKATVERDIDDPSIEINRIRVEVNVNNLKEWVKAKQSIREIVTRAERDEVEIYPIVDRKRD